MTGQRRAHRGLMAAGALIAWLVLPAVALAHPLGNFTINHYAGLRVNASEIRLDVVLDRAEIPTFQERLALDTDGDGELSPAEEDAAREPGCRTLATELELTIDGAPAVLQLTAAGLQFPPGAGGLPTMRLVCQFMAPIEGGLAGGRAVSFADRSFADRLGWREIVVEGDGTTIAPEGEVPSAALSKRLTEYPSDRLQAPLTISEVRFRVTGGGPTLPPFTAPDAQPLTGGGPVASTVPPAGVVPGGVGADIPEVFRVTDPSPAVLLLAIGTALALGAGHALTPGHGKTLMAAYLVGTRGTAVHALGLGLSVTVSHTIGILALAALVVAAQGVLAPDVVVRWLPLVAAVTIVAIGAWMVAAEVRRRGAEPAHGHAHGHAHGDAHAHPHDHERGHDHDPGPAAATPVDPFSHSHGGVRHSHQPAGGTTITWRSLFALGLAGGIIPSTSALLVLLGTIAAGRPAFGIVLVVAFGVGMAVVLGGVGLLLVKGRALLDRLPGGSTLGATASLAPLAAAVLVLALGIWLTGQAVTGGAVL